MYQSARQLINSKVFDPDGRYVCKIKKVVIDPNNGQVLGFVTSLSRPINILSLMDVADWKQEYILLEDDYEFHEQDEIVRINKALQAHCELFNKAVRTESKQKLGFVTDYTLDIKNHMLMSITVQKRFFRLFYYAGKIIHQKNIVEITPRFVIVKDAMIKIPTAEKIQEKSIEHSPAI